jgi:hypothetical protein
MKELVTSILFVLFSCVILIVITVNQTYGINLMEGISWPRFTTTKDRRKTTERHKTDEEVTKQDERKVRLATTHLPPTHELNTPKIYNANPPSKFETSVQAVVESIFPQVGFRTVRPDFNMGDKGRALEFDIYSHCFRLSIEAHGRQHYEFVPRYHKTIHDLYDQQHRDELTRRNAENAGLTHIEVPYTCKTDDAILDCINSQLGDYTPVFYCTEGCGHDLEYRMT